MNKIFYPFLCVVILLVFSIYNDHLISVSKWGCSSWTSQERERCNSSLHSCNLL